MRFACKQAPTGVVAGFSVGACLHAKGFPISWLSVRLRAGSYRDGDDFSGPSRRRLLGFIPRFLKKAGWLSVVFMSPENDAKSAVSAIGLPGLKRAC